MRRQQGFTLIELLVVILIIALLTAIAIPVFLRQREKGREAQVQSTLRHAATAIESYYLRTGSFDTLNADPHLRTKLAAEGFPWPDWAVSAPGRLAVKSSSSTYCIETRHAALPTSNAWSEAIYRPEVGAPQADPNTCP